MDGTLMSMAVLRKLRKDWLEEGEAHFSQSMDALIRGSNFLRGVYMVHNQPLATDARVPSGVYENRSRGCRVLCTTNGSLAGPACSDESGMCMCPVGFRGRGFGRTRLVVPSGKVE